MWIRRVGDAIGADSSGALGSREGRCLGIAVGSALLKAGEAVAQPAPGALRQDRDEPLASRRPLLQRLDVALRERDAAGSAGRCRPPCVDEDAGAALALAV